jgi:hypothetical protein
MAERCQAARIAVSSFRQDACVMSGVALVLDDHLRRPRLNPSGPASPTRFLAEREPETALRAIS